MPNAYILNQVPITYGEIMSLVVEMLISAGWTYRSSGDGLAGYSATGKIFTHKGAGALGWHNTKAWARVQDPGGGREFVFQHDAAGLARIKYSAAAKFTAGSPSATITPNATDERMLRGGTNDTTPDYSAQPFFSASSLVTTGQVKFQGCALSDPPYGFWWASAATPNGTNHTGLMLDPVIGAAGDPDPVVIYCGGYAQDGTTWQVNQTAFRCGSLTSAGVMAATVFYANGGDHSGCFAHSNTSMTAFQSYQPGYILVGAGGDGGGTGGWTIQSSGFAENPFNGNSDVIPVLYMRPQIAGLTYLGIKGWSTMMRWTGVARPNFGATLDSRKWIAVGNVWLPWDGVTVPYN